MQQIAPVTVANGAEKPVSLAPDQKRALVQRVVDSQAFRRAPAMRAFLLYVTDHEIAGHTDKLKEQTIGTEVLGRKPNYDPADDNIVRVRAHELRERLERFFASDGIEEPVVVTIPRGAYAPEFVPRKTVIPEAPVATQPAEIVPGNEVETRPTAWRWLPFAGIVLIAIAASVAVTRYSMRSDNPSSVHRPPGAMTDLWGQFFDRPNEELKVVYADASYALWQDLDGKSLNLADYLNHMYLKVPDDPHLDVATRSVTSEADISVATHLGVMVGEFGGQINLQYARDTSTDFLHHGNLVLIGSRRSNPWVEIYEPSLNFQLGRDSHSGAPIFVNRSPKHGELPVYAIPAMFDVQPTEEVEFVSYGLVALVKSCSNRGLTVIAEGLNMQGTQAAGDFITDPHRLNTLLQSIGHKPGTNVAPFEALIQVTSLPGGYDNPKIAAFRLQPAESCSSD